MVPAAPEVPRASRRAAILAIAALSLLGPSAAVAAPSGGSSAPGAGKAAAGKKGAAKPALVAPPGGAAATAPPGTKELGAAGQVDPISGLGIRNPVCDRIGQIEARRTRLSCQLNGTPESNYPASNYGFDVFIDSGIDAPSGTFAKGFVMILNGYWLGMVFVLKLVLALLGLAFGLNPFAEGETMRRIAVAIGRVYDRVTDPWLSALIVCAGIWFAHKGLVRREVAAGVAGTLAAIALLIVGLWVVHSPRASVGAAAKLSDELALAVIAAPQAGSVARPSGSYAEAMSRTWSQLVEVPFAGLNFSDVEWALGPPPAEAVERADRKFCEDVGALALLAMLSRLGNERAIESCADLTRRRYGAPRRVIDLYLRSSPGSPARRELWRYFDKDEADAYKAKVAAQGGDGVLTRLSMLALFAIGLLGAILLLAWLAIRLFTQAAIGFVLILVAPLALFFPLLGDSGRRAFKTWGLTLLGAIAAKVIYAAFLSVVLLGITILGSVGGAMGFLLSCAFTWSVFLKRAELVGWLSIGEAERAAGRGMAGQLAALTLGRRAPRAVGGAARGVARGASGWAGARAADGAEATRRSAGASLRGSARALAEQRHGEARRTVTEFEARHGRPAPQAGGPGQRSPDSATAASAAPANAAAAAAAPPPAPTERRRYERAQELLTRADRNQRSLGERWSERDLERFGEEDRALLRHSRDPADHAHRAGLGRAEFEVLRGPDRERAEAAIEAARKRDRHRLEVAAEVPGRVVGRGRQAAERLRQHRESGAPARREQLRGLRRERRAERPPRRNLSRGA
jgi:hypothetical protein